MRGPPLPCYLLTPVTDRQGEYIPSRSRPEQSSNLLGSNKRGILGSRYTRSATDLEPVLRGAGYSRETGLRIGGVSQIELMKQLRSGRPFGAAQIPCITMAAASVTYLLMGAARRM